MISNKTLALFCGLIGVLALFMAGVSFGYELLGQSIVFLIFSASMVVLIYTLLTSDSK